MHMPSKEHEFPILTVDGAVFEMVDDKLNVLLIKRAFKPFLGDLALPGVYVSKDETTREALNRVLKDKTGLDAKQVSVIEQPYAFDMSKRDPRGYAVTVMYIGLGKGLTLGDGAATNLQDPQFVDVTKLPKLAYDHASIVDFARGRLKVLAMSTNAVAALLPKRFTFLQLQTTYEAILGSKLDKRNFRKKMLQRGLVEPTNKIEKDGAHRPAELYRFCKTTPTFS